MGFDYPDYCLSIYYSVISKSRLFNSSAIFIKKNDSIDYRVTVTRLLNSVLKKSCFTKGLKLGLASSIQFPT